VAGRAANDPGIDSADWSKAYADYLTKSAAQNAKTAKLYQEVLEGVSHGRLSPTIFQDHYLQFAQSRGAAYASRFSELGAEFLSGLVRIGTMYAQHQPGLAGEAEQEIRPPRFEPGDASRWAQQLAEYAGLLNARALKAYKAQLDRVAAGEITPGEVQQESADYLSRRMPGYLQELGQLYFGVLQGLNDLRTEYEEEYYLGMLGRASRKDESQPLVLTLTAPLGESAEASLEVANSTRARTAIRCTVTEVRRADAVGPAFPPKVSVTPEELELDPGEEGALRLTVWFEELRYDPGALYTGTLFISGQGELPVEVLLRLTALPARQLQENT
jgi:hypothetical protein